MSKIILYNDGEMTQSILDHRGLRLDVPAGEKVIILDHSKDITSQAYLKSFYNHYNEFLEVTCDMDDYPLSDTTLSSMSVKFSSDTDFTLSAPKNWDGVIEYTLDNGFTWTEWDGTQLSGTADQSIYLRGKNNTIITGNSSSCEWFFTGKYCIGNIENLLDCNKVKLGQHPVMGDYCYKNMFRNCSSLEVLPELSANTLSNYCYCGMFLSCSGIKALSENYLPATTLAISCYNGMFTACRGIKEIPGNLLPATTLTESCYEYMFQNCSGLTTLPENLLPATTLAKNCYSSMFMGCSGLTSVPNLPATTLANNCYKDMFNSCNNLTSIPLKLLPATALAQSCYNYMFAMCQKLKTLPELPATILANNCYASMFANCKLIKLSTTKTGNYTISYRIPTSGTGTVGTNSLSNMFSGTGGTYAGTPVVNTTYYLDQT